MSCTHLELYSHHVKRGGAGQDGGAGLQEVGQGGATVPEEQRVPGQEAGAEVRLPHQDRDLGRTRSTLISASCFMDGAGPLTLPDAPPGQSWSTAPA